MILNNKDIFKEYGFDVLAHSFYSGLVGSTSGRNGLGLWEDCIDKLLYIQFSLGLNLNSYYSGSIVCVCVGGGVTGDSLGAGVGWISF